MAKETTVWIKPLDLPWEQVGTGGFQGITPENINLEADTWGPSNATFDLRRDPDAPALDLSAGAEVEVHVAGVNVWDGFVSSTPKKRGDLVVSVVCRGWQDELDGRIFTAGYVHTSLTDFKDARSFTTTPLGNMRANGRVEASNGSIVLGWGNGAVIQAGDGVGVILDLGPNLTGKRVVLSYSNEGVAAGSYTLYAKGIDSPADIIAAGDTAWSGDPATAGSPQAGTLSTARRYVAILLYSTGSATLTADRLVRIAGCQVFAATAYESGNASVLKASTVVSDALDRGTLALSSDRSGIDATSFNIPDLWLDPKGVTARELISKVNAYHNWTAKLEPGRRFVFRARTTVPKVKVGEWSALPDDEDASANDITEVYNHCRATSTEPGGTLVVVDRYSAQQVGATFDDVTTGYAANPSFATNTAGWTAGTSTITRDTGTYDTAPASGRWDNTGASDALAVGDTISYALAGTFRAGLTYRLTIRGLTSAGIANLSTTFTGTIGYLSLGTAWITRDFYYSPRVDAVNPALTFALDFASTALYVWLDGLTVTVSKPTILDKRGRLRSQILDATAALPADGVALTQLADTWLAAHTTTPFKGKQAIQGAHSVRDYLTGDNVAPERLLAMTTDLLHFDDRINPDTGDVGRDGRIVKVSYQPLTDTVQTDVDSARSDFGALLARIGVLASSA